MNGNIYDYDNTIAIRSFERKVFEAEIKGLAEQSALEQHPVVHYVRTLPREPTTYPAIRYLKPNASSVEEGTSKKNQKIDSERTSERISRNISGNLPAKISENIESKKNRKSKENKISENTESITSGNNKQDIQEIESIFIDNTDKEIDEHTSIGKAIDDYNEWAFGQGILSEFIDNESRETVFEKNIEIHIKNHLEALRTPSTLDQYVQNGSDLDEFEEDVPYMVWSMPASDIDRPKDKGCGFISSYDNNGPLFVSCEKSAYHHCKAKCKHCWSLLCPNCMNDTALKNGIEVERQFLTYAKLSKKQGIDVGPLKHWVVSPPQEYARSAFQRADTYDELNRHIQDSMMCFGSEGGLIIPHPWRQKSDKWEFSPHFHVLSYGRIDTKRFLRNNPGWVIKLVHSGEKIRSIRHTAAYLFTHMGIPKSERPVEEIDFDMDFLNYMMPGFSENNTKEQKQGRRPEYHFSEKDHEKAQEGKGRMVGDLSDFDWVEWTKDKLVKEHRIRYFGCLSRSKLRLVAVYRTYRARRCKTCGCILKIHDGLSDTCGKQANYIRDIGIYAFAKDYESIIAELKGFRSTLMDGQAIVDIAKQSSAAISTDELGMDESNDITLIHPLALVTIFDDGTITQEISA